MDTTRSPNADLEPEDRANIIAYLLALSTDVKLQRGALSVAAEEFKCSTMTTGRLWSKTVSSLETTGKLPDFSAPSRSRCGRKKKWGDIGERIRLVPWCQRGNLRSLAAALKIPKTSVFRALREGNILRHSNAVKPYLNDESRRQRLSFCLSFVNPESMKFRRQGTPIHIDEKWFYLTRTDQTYYLAPGETPSCHSVQSKHYITKMMFLAAVMRLVIESGTVIFDGKIDIRPFVVKEKAVRSSKNRPAGTMKLKPVVADRVEHRKMMVNYDIPSIKAKVLASMKQQALVIQQDGARTHVLEDDAAVLAACAEGGWNIQLNVLPPNTPDLNVLDLGFFCSIQALQHELAPFTIEELVDYTEQAYEALESTKLDNTFLSLQQVMGCIIKEFGANTYNRPHMSKDELRKQGRLPRNIACCETAFLAAHAYQFLSSLDD